MKQIEDLQKRWHESVRFRGLHATMSLEKDALVLGAGTVLARRDRDGALVLDGEDAKLLTLLSVACGQPVRASVLGIVRKASRHARAGDDAMAAMYLALAKLPKLHDPSDSARRLFIADALMAEGVSPRDIWTALDFDPAPLDELDKRYNPDQPRVPAGSGKTSGEWTSGDAPGASSARVVPQDAVDAAERAAAAEGDAAAETLAERTWWASVLALGPRAAGPLVFMSALLYSTPAGGERRFGRVPGHPDLTWDEEEGLFTVARESDGEVVLQAKRGPDGKLRVIKYRGLERLQNEHSQIDPDLLPADDPRATHRDEPGFCPEPPKPDPGGTAYATFIRTGTSSNTTIASEKPAP
jgi:hypothetical protein